MRDFLYNDFPYRDFPYRGYPYVLGNEEEGRVVSRKKGASNSARPAADPVGALISLLIFLIVLIFIFGSSSFLSSLQ